MDYLGVVRLLALSHWQVLVSLANHDVKLCGFAFAQDPLELLCVVPSDHCLVDKYMPASVIAIDETMCILDVKPSNGTEHLLISATPQVDTILYFLEQSSGPPILCQGVPVAFSLEMASTT